MLASEINWNPFGPIITPEMINPINPGTLNLLKIMGENRMINRRSEKVRIGFSNGNLNSPIKC
jgi:hypothetical protein